MAFSPVKERFFVPDLSPQFHPKVWKGVVPQTVFVAESPHVHEISPENQEDRRPLCGAAGKQWWSALSEILEGKENQDVDLKRLLQVCVEGKFAVLNAVQLPLDPKIEKHFPKAHPLKILGFAKASGDLTFKSKKLPRASQTNLEAALHDLKTRLNHPSISKAEVYCLGLDATWFVQRALGKEEFARRVKGRLAHPSAWWRRGGLFGRQAKESLEHILSV